MLETRTISISINRNWNDVYEAIWRPEGFPKWASGLSKSSLAKYGEVWKAEGPEGPITIRFTDHNVFGVMDHYVDVGVGPALGCQRRCRAFQIEPKFIHIGEIRPVRANRVGDAEASRFGARLHGAARALPAVDQAIRAQALRHLADNRLAYAEAGGEILAGREFRTDRVDPVADVAGHLLGDLLGQG